ncbi:MAG: nucleotidyltransferase family protein [Fimbriimonadales bacterium]|nr:nucleotidyltransferase family protein [Fimbriimonadales bacterium]
MMTALQEAAIDVGSFLEGAHIPYVLIGGFAVQHWGEPRTTRDIDIEILVSEEHKEAVFRKILERYRPRYDDALEFALQQRVLLIYASNGVPVDIALAAPGYGELIAQRRQLIQVAPNQPMVAVISAEDLIVHKCLAHRPVDLQDVESILKRQRGKLDIEYIRACLESFAPYVWEFDLVGEFEQLLNRSE